MKHIIHNGSILIKMKNHKIVMMLEIDPLEALFLSFDSFMNPRLPAVTAKASFVSKKSV